MKITLEDMCENFFSIIKVIPCKSIANIILKWEKLKAFPEKSGMRQRYPYFPFVFKTVLIILNLSKRKNKIKQEKEQKGYEMKTI